MATRRDADGRLGRMHTCPGCARLGGGPRVADTVLDRFPASLLTRCRRPKGIPSIGSMSRVKDNGSPVSLRLMVRTGCVPVLDSAVYPIRSVPLRNNEVYCIVPCLMFRGGSTCVDACPSPHPALAMLPSQGCLRLSPSRSRLSAAGAADATVAVAVADDGVVSLNFSEAPWLCTPRLPRPPAATPTDNICSACAPVLWTSGSRSGALCLLRGASPARQGAQEKRGAAGRRPLSRRPFLL